jgi:hypothetical protein
LSPWCCGPREYVRPKWSADRDQNSAIGVPLRYLTLCTYALQARAA